jgi:hypothetical protein
MLVSLEEEDPIKPSFDMENNARSEAGSDFWL